MNYAYAFPAPGGNDLVQIVEETVNAPNSARLIVRWRNFGYDEDQLYGIDARSQRMADMFQNFYLRVQTQFGVRCVTTVTAFHQDHIELVNSRIGWGVGPSKNLDFLPDSRDDFGGKIYDSSDQFLYDLADALHNLSNSAQEVSFDMLEFQLDLFALPEIVGGMKITTLASKALKTNQRGAGIAKQHMNKDMKDMCGWYCLLQALATKPAIREAWVGDLEWLTRHLPDNRLFEKKRKLVWNLMRKLQQNLGIHNDVWQLMPVEGLSTIEKITAKQPKLQIVVMTSQSKILNTRSKGADFVWKTEDSATIYLDFSINFEHRTGRGHLEFIKSINAYYGRARLAERTLWCCTCLDFHLNTEMCLHRQFPCESCGFEFQDKDLLDQHKSESPAWSRPQCPDCYVECFGQSCLELHSCRAQDKCPECLHVLTDRPIAEHVCGQYVCKTCSQHVDPGHVCYLQKPESIEEVDVPPQDYGTKYYAFDFESAFYPHPTNPNMNMHVVNCVAVRQCYTNNVFTFKNLGEFLNWIQSLEDECTLYAHNFSGYDGRLLYEALVASNCTLTDVLKRGSKFLQFSYGVVQFRDVMLHIKARLEDMPKMFNMDTTQLKKGFYPYAFNTPNHENYVGPWPGIEFYDPGLMSTKKKTEFLQWHSENCHKVWNHNQETLEYCVSDVNILTKAMERYLERCLSHYPLDPWSCLTIASYALKVYMTYHMPEETIAVESAETCRQLQPALHGGRVDVRRMLKEWTQEEIDAGKYGKYQDVQSLYPATQFFDYLPVGPGKKTFYQPGDPVPDFTTEPFKDFFGIVCCDIHPAKYLFHPVLVSLTDSKLQADLLPKIKESIASVELHNAIAQGYVVTRVYHTIEYVKDNTTQKSYMRKHNKSKIESSGKQPWIKTPEDWEEFKQKLWDHMQITIDQEDVVFNPAQKTVDKLLCNALWGKFAETAKPTVTAQFDMTTDQSKYMAFLKKWQDRNIIVKSMRSSPDHVKLMYDYQDRDMDMSPQRRKRIWLAGAVFVTANARTRLLKEMTPLGDRVLYHDTDSIIYEHDPEKYNIPEGRYLGEWECETGGIPIVKFVSIGPKCYAYVTADGKTVCKVKGVTLNSHNDAILNYESMKQMVLKNQEEVKTKNILFKYDPGSVGRPGGMITGIIEKIVRVTYSKGVVDPTTLTIYPIGADALDPSVPRNLQLWKNTNLQTSQTLVQ